MKTMFSLTGYTIFLLLVWQSLPAQIMSTFAGNGQSGYSGNNGPATSAMLSDALGVCSDLSGNIYIADHANHVVRMVDRFNTIKPFAGDGTQGYSGDGGQAAHAKMDYPYGLYAGKNGNIYISDRARNIIRQVNAAGIITTIAGTSVPGYSGDGGPAIHARLSSPMGITGDEDGNIYWVEFVNLVVRKMDKNGIISTIAGNNTRGYSGDGGPAINAQLNSPVGICADKAGNIYIADTDNLVVRKVNKAGNITTVAGNNTRGYSGDGGAATSAQLSSPYAVLVDSTGVLYIGDTRNHVVRKVDTDGIITTFAGTGQAGSSGDGDAPERATFSAPSSICMDADGNMYIADPESHVVRKAGICKQAIVAVQPENASTCINDDVTFYTESEDADAVYEWRVNSGDGWSAISDGAIYNGTATQSLIVKNVSSSMNGYQYQCVITNNCGQVSTIPVSLTVTNPDAISTLNIESSGEICEGEAIRFQATLTNSTGTPTYQWYVNDSVLPDENNSSFSSTKLNNADRVQCIVTSDASCLLNPAAISNEIVVKINPSVISDINIQASGIAVCAKTPVSFTASTHNEGLNPRYIWEKNGNETGENSPTYKDSSLNDNDIITCTLISSTACTDTAFSNAITITVYPLPLVTFDTNEIIIARGTHTILQPETGGNIIKYEWNPVVGLSSNNIANPVVTSGQDEKYTLQVTTNEGCSNSASVMIKLYKPLWMPSAFTPNGDGKNDIFRIPPEIPLTLKQFTIYNRWGKKVFETASKDQGWNGRSHPGGIYIWLITYVDGLSNKTITQKGSFLLIE